jgi:pSer/pThr/pTyr-binding forkhead associated (FHA) protein
VCRDHAIERAWGLLGPPEVTFEVDDALGKGRFRCAASLVEGAERLEPWKLTRTPATGTPGASAAAGEPHGPVVLAFLDGSGAAAGKTVRIQKPKVTVGRLPESDVVVNDPGASRHHAQIEQRDGGYVLTDLGSTNGTLVNDQPVTTYRLQLGDRITIGETVLEVRGG